MIIKERTTNEILEMKIGKSTFERVNNRLKELTNDTV